MEGRSPIVASTANPFTRTKEFSHFSAAQPTTRDGSRPICGRYFEASVVIMTPSHDLSALEGNVAVSDVTFVIAVEEPRCNFTQVDLSQWLAALRTERRRGRYPAVHQDEFHVPP